MPRCLSSAVLAMVALLAPGGPSVHAQETLSACDPGPDLDQVKAQFGVTAHDEQSTLLARSANKKWATATAVDKLLFKGRENWLNLDVLPATVCGEVRSVELFEHRASFDEADTHFYVVPPEGTAIAGLLGALANGRVRAADVKRCSKRAPEPSDPLCIYSEVTPNEEYEGRLCGNGAYCAMTDAWGGEPWNQIRSVCLRGPLVLERFHGFRPEIHPSELMWAPLDQRSWLLMVVRDASQRFDETRFLSAWNPDTTATPWSRGGRATFQIWFDDAQDEASFDIDAVVGDKSDRKLPRLHLPRGKASSDTLEWADGRMSATAGRCLASSGAQVGNLTLTINAGQRKPEESGRTGASEAAAVRVTQEAKSGWAPLAQMPKREERVSGSQAVSPPAAPPRIAVRSWLRPETDPDDERISVIRVGADFLPAGGEGDEEKADLLNQLGAKHPHRVRFDARLTFRSKQAGLEYRPMPDSFSKGCESLRDVVEYMVSRDPATELTANDAKTRQGGMRFPEYGFAEVSFCLPQGPNKSVTVDAQVRAEYRYGTEGSKTIDSPGQTVSLPVVCDPPNAVDRARTLVKKIVKNAAQADQLLGYGTRLLELAADDKKVNPSDETPKARLGRAVFALALSVAQDCPLNLKDGPWDGDKLLTAAIDAYLKAKP